MNAVNLLPPDLRGARRPASAAVVAGDEATGRAGAFAVLGVLAFCVVALAAYVLASNTVKDRRAELQQATAQAQAVTRKATALKPYADFAATAQERVETVKDLAAARFDWEQAMRDISRVVPPGVTLSALNASIASGTTSGGSSLRSAIAAPAVALTGCTTGGQVAVATLLSRLKNVDGVTRVSLSKSDKPDAVATTAPATTSGPATGCGQSRAPQFEIVVFFEHAQVPATVQDVTVGGSGSTGSSSASGTTPASSGSTSTSTTSSTSATSSTGSTAPASSTPTSAPSSSSPTTTTP